MKTEKTTKSKELTQVNNCGHILRKNLYSPSCGVSYDKIVKKHGYFYDEESRSRCFGVVEKQNIHEEIQSHLIECDNEFVKHHLLENGSSVIPDELFGDCADIQSDLLDSINRVRSANDLFKSLPLKVREKYGNDINRFAVEFKIDDFIKKDKSEVIKDENKE